MKNTHKDSRFNDWSKTTVKLTKRRATSAQQVKDQWTKYGKAKRT